MPLPPLLSQYNRSLNSNSSRTVPWDTSPPSSWSAGFPNKVIISCPNNSSLCVLTYCTAMSLDLVTLTAPQPSLCCCSCSVSLQWECKCGDCCSHLSHSREHGHTWHADTWQGDAQLWEVVWALSLPSFLYALCLEGRNPSSCDLGRPSGRCSHSYS